jgi:hypothetical protein
MAGKKPVSEEKKENKKPAAATAKPDSKKRGIGTAAGTLAGIVIVALLLVGAVIYLNLSAFSKVAVERLASRALGVPVTITEMSVNLDEMSVIVSGLSIGNLPDYISPQLAEVGTIAIYAESLSREKLVFNDIQVQNARLFLDITEKGTNLQALNKNLQARMENEPAAQNTAQGGAQDGAQGTEKSGTKIAARNIKLSGITLMPSTTLSDRELEPVILPDIVGSISEDVTPQRAVMEIGRIVMQTATRSALRAGVLQGALDEAKKKFGIEDDQARSIKNSIRGLFGGE